MSNPYVGMENNDIMLTDVSNASNSNIFEVQKVMKIDQRIDSVLETASLQIITNLDNSFVNNDMPPLTPAYWYGRHWFANSEMHLMVTNPSYKVHNVTLIEPLKALEKFIVGGKTFSKSNSRGCNAWINITDLLAIINDKYGTDLELPESFLYGTETDVKPILEANTKEYTFGSGATLLDCLIAIASDCNLWPYCDKDTLFNSFTIKFKSLDITSATTFSLTSGTYEDLILTNDVDEYCSQMELEADEVIDRTNYTTIDDLGFRSTGESITFDNACLVLPSEIEKVIGLYIKHNKFKVPVIQVPQTHFGTDSTTESKADDDTTTITTAQIWHDLNSAEFGANWNGTDSGTQFAVFDYLQEILLGASYLANTTTGNYHYYVIEKDNPHVTTDTPCYCFCYKGNTTVIDSEYKDYSQWILDKANYDLLEKTEAPKYVYWDGNVIDGFHNEYNENLMNSIIYGSSGPFFLEHNVARDKDDLVAIPENTTVYSYQSSDMKGFMSYDYSTTSSNYMKYFNWFAKVVYVAKTPMTFIAKRTGYTTSARTMDGNNSGVDFDLLQERSKGILNRTGNSTLSVTLRNGNPQLLNKITYKSRDYYITSIQTTITFVNDDDQRKLMIVNATANKPSLAAAFALTSQYNPTLIPQSGIIDRHIYCEISESVPAPLEANLPRFLCLPYDTDNYCAMRLITLKHDNKTYYVAQMQDSFAVGSKKTATSNASVYRNELIGIPTTATSSDSTEIRLGRFRMNNADGLPLIGIPNLATNYSKTIVIRRDPRERLIFTIKII